MYRPSLRTIVVAAALAGAVLVALVIWAGGKVVAFARARGGERALEARGVYVQGRNVRDIEWGQFFRERDQFAVHVGPGKRFELKDWQQLNSLGPLWDLGLTGVNCNSAQAYECVRRNQATLRELKFTLCPLTPELAAAIGECSELQSLSFRGVQDGGKFSVPPLPKLTAVRFQYSTISGKHLVWLADQPALERLALSGPVSDEMVIPLLACKTLRDVDVGECSISLDGVRRLLAGLPLRGITFSAVPLGSVEFNELLESRVQRVGLEYTKLLDSPASLLACERIKHVAISRFQFERLVATEIDLKRETRLQLDVHGLTQFRDVAVNPWSSCVDLRRYDIDGAFLGERIATDNSDDEP